MNKEQQTIHEFDLSIIHDFFSNTERQGPGSPEETLKALGFIDGLTEKSKIADIGCGTGGQTMVLGENTGCEIIGVDACPDFINQFNHNAQIDTIPNKLDQNVKPKKQIMMKTKLILLILLLTGITFTCHAHEKQNKQTITRSENTLIGQWVRMGQMGPISFEFKDNGLVEGDFGNDQTIDVIASYELSGDTIKFIDTDGQMCEGYGLYKVYQTDYYVSFDLIDDDCSGRISTTMGFWTKPEFKDFLKILNVEISKSPKPELYLSRARIFLATGMISQAKDDFDQYLSTDTLDAGVYVNRAGTRFPNDLNGVIFDCNKAISLDPNNKNAYFLRGLARYESGEKEQGCEDFSKAIELGFSVLRIAEQEKCIDFWDQE